MDRITDAFAWPLRDPDWLTKVLIIALILLIPIVGGINGLGWMLASLDRLRAGEERLAPAIGINKVRATISTLGSQSGSFSGQANASVMRSTSDH